MQALQIFIDTLTPIGYSLRKQPHPLHLDGLIIAAMTARKKRKFVSGSSDPYAPGTGIVPLGVSGKNSPIYQTSNAFLTDDPINSRFSFTKKHPAADLNMFALRNSKKLTFSPGGTSSGKDKGWLESIQTTHTNGQVVFRCIGIKNEIEPLLSEIPGLGAMRRIGLGQIINFTIEEVEGVDYDTWGLISDNGLPLCELPLEDWPEPGPGWMKTFAAVRPPHYFSGNRELCWVPDYQKTVPGY